MAKKKGGKKSAPQEDDDAYSLSSTGTAFSALTEVEVLDAEADAFQQVLDDTYESRASTREKAWERLITMLRTSVRQDDCHHSAVTVTSRCQVSLRKGGATEASLAATALGLHILTLGESSERLFIEELFPDLSKAAGQGKGAVVKVAALEALAICCFVAAEDEVTTLTVMAGMQRLWAQDSSKVRAAALRSWTFLLASLRHPLDADSAEALLATLAGLLHDPDVDVRGAAGEAVVLTLHVCGLSGGQGGLEEVAEEEDDEECGLAPAGGGSADAMSVASVAGSGVDDVVGRMRQLATSAAVDRREGGLRRSRRDRATMRATFRSILAGVDGAGGGRELRIKLRHGDTLVVDTPTGVATLTFLRRFLLGGFQEHLQSNALLHAVFEFAPLEARGERLSALEKRAYRSPSSAASKSRTRNRNSQRGCKAAALEGGGGW